MLAREQKEQNSAEAKNVDTFVGGTTKLLGRHVARRARGRSAHRGWAVRRPQRLALVDWKQDINHSLRRDILPREQFERLMTRVGATPDTTLLLYGDMRNWFAAFAFWTFKIYGHQDVRFINGGRRKWIEEGRPITEEVPSFSPTSYSAAEA